MLSNQRCICPVKDHPTKSGRCNSRTPCKLPVRERYADGQVIGPEGEDYCLACNERGIAITVQRGNYWGSKLIDAKHLR